LVSSIDVHRSGDPVREAEGGSPETHRSHPMRSDITIIDRQRGPARTFDLETGGGGFKGWGSGF